jgi:hypothetical protein
MDGYQRVIQVQEGDCFTRKVTQERFLSFVADILSAGKAKFTPYLLENNVPSSPWVVDEANDWWVYFDDADSSLVRLHNRWGNREALNALAAWIAAAKTAKVRQLTAAER